MNPRSVFLSYGQPDGRWARQFADALQQHNIKVSLSSEIPAGSNWKEWLRSALDTSSCVVGVLSRKSEHSASLLFELGAAQASGKPIIGIVPGDRSLSLPLIQTRKSLTRLSPQETARQLIADLDACASRSAGQPRTSKSQSP